MLYKVFEAFLGLVIVTILDMDPRYIKENSRHVHTWIIQLFPDAETFFKILKSQLSIALIGVNDSHLIQCRSDMSIVIPKFFS